MTIFVQFMETGEEALGEQVRTLEKEGDQIKARNIGVLSRAFATPIDREDIYRAIMAIDDVLNYAKTTVREISALGIEPDEHMAEMAGLIRDGSLALRDGFAKLATSPADADTDADAARKTERSTEKVYRAALAELFQAEDHIEGLSKAQQSALAEADVVRYIIDVFKRRELYRHLSNAADRVDYASGVLHQIVVQVA
jgi:uncharacterized protein Yka (UPF0111/DUF47 family)